MNAKKLFLFDMDNTIRRSTVEGQPCPNRDGEWELLPDVMDRMGEIDWNSTALGAVSNQGGIGLGYLTQETAHKLIEDALVAATGTWCPVWPIEICPHKPDAGCECRKPKPLMIHRAIHRAWTSGLNVKSADDVLYVGDQADDFDAAANARVPFMWAHEFFRWKPEGTAAEFRMRGHRVRTDGASVSVCIEDAFAVLPEFRHIAASGGPFPMWAKVDDIPIWHGAALSQARAEVAKW